MLQIISIIIGVLALIPVFWFIKSKFGKKHGFEINYKNAMLLPIVSDGYPNGHLALVFYGIKVINLSDSGRTIKALELQCNVNGKKRVIDSYFVHPGKIKTGQNAVVVTNNIDTIFLMNWNNLRSEIGDYKVLVQGAILNGSAVFVIESEQNDVLLDNASLVIIDYSGARTKQRVELQESLKDAMGKGFKLINSRFELDDNDQIIWEKG